MIALVGGACGGGGAISPNDPEPTGTLVDSGEWIPQNGRTVTGSVLIYSSASGAYTFRLSGISAPNETGLQLIAVSSTGVRFNLGNLRAISGNQNYTVESGVTTWSQFLLYSAPNSINYGQVLF